MQFRRQNKDYEKTKTRIMEIANYVDKVRLVVFLLQAVVLWWTKSSIPKLLDIFVEFIDILLPCVIDDQSVWGLLPLISLVNNR